MGWAEINARAVNVVTRTLGETVTHVAGDGTETVVSAIVQMDNEALFGGFAAAEVTEQRWSCIVNVADVTPAHGDIIQSAAGVRYQIDNRPEQDTGIWRFVLRAAITAYTAFQVADGAGGFEAFYVADGAGGFDALQVLDNG